MEPYIEYNEFVATRQQIASRMSIQDRDLVRTNMSVERYQDQILQETIFQVTKYFWELETTDTIEVPSSWWQAFKEQVYPAWMQKIFIVKYSEINIKRVRICPHLVGEKNQNHLKFLTLDQEALRVVPTSLSEL